MQSYGLHPPDAVQGFGCSPTSVLQRKWCLYRQTHCLQVLWSLSTCFPKFKNHFAIETVCFQVQLEADGYFFAQEVFAFAFTASRASWYQLAIFESDFTNPNSKTLVGFLPNPIFSTKLRRLRILADAEQANFFRKNLFYENSRWFIQYCIKPELLLPVLKAKSGSVTS